MAREVKASPLGEGGVLILVAASAPHPIARLVLGGVAAERVELEPRPTRTGKESEIAQKTRTLYCCDAKCLLKVRKLSDRRKP